MSASNNDNNILNDLNESQRQAVLYNDGPSLVIAGAGSGKTRVLTYKIAYLLQLGLQPESIMALTFTNKAAKEMKSRIASMVGWQVSRHLMMGTFHSIFGRILRNEAETLGFTRDFSIYDATDTKNQVKAIIKEMNLNDKVYKPNSVACRISNAKNNLITAKAYSADKESRNYDSVCRTPMISDIYLRYAARCKAANAMDFDDMLLFTNILFRDYSDILDKYKNFFQYILVDEYQDTNLAQAIIVSHLAESHHRLCVVGDDAQSIYSFRGANIENILGFQRSHAGSRIFKLEQNYRSTQTIVNAANSLIDKNKGQIRKNVFSENEEGEKLQLNEVYSDYEEASLVANTIEKLHDDSNYSDMAILYRTNAQSRVLEEALRKSDIAYRIYGGISFYQRKEIKNALAYFRLILNPDDEEALKRAINTPSRGIGDTTVKKILDCTHTQQTSPLEVMAHPLEHNLDVNQGTANKLLKFVMLIASAQEKLADTNAYDLGCEIIKMSGLIADTMKDSTSESLNKRENLEELLKAIHEFSNAKSEETGEIALLPEFMSEVALLTDQDEKDTDDGNHVTLMTIHASKGLEFKHIFIVGVEEELFPSCMAQTERDIEEERRLFYVAITRAKSTCHISYAKSRFINGKSTFCNPSRFLKDIDSQFLTSRVSASPMASSFFDKGNTPVFGHQSYNPFNQTPSTGKTQPVQHPQPIVSRRLTKMLPQNSSSSDLPAEYQGITIGTKVEHVLFGIGTVSEILNDGANSRASIDFENVGTKKLLLKFAKLKIID